MNEVLNRMSAWCLLALSCSITMAAEAQPAEVDTSLGDRLAAEYFEIETAKLSGDLVGPDTTLRDWQSKREGYRAELAEMLGLDPMPPRTPLRPVVVSTTDHDGFQLDRLHFQPMPGLYVAANFYRPISVADPLPTILYVCGHSRQTDGDVSFGNKAGYHHHGVWFARNGYACLIVDTIQLGEFLGDHHGTYRLGRWWWPNRGYTPAGVEAWTAIRALDYLEMRPEVDSRRFGVTGRSGGGIYSWWVAALDDRIQVAVPVAGITTLHNYVVDGCVEGHCDCMFMVNTYRWDYPQVAALVAPRPLLISNSDKDRIFPLDGVVELHRQVRDVYRLYDAEDKLGLQITEGPHQDTQNLRVHAFNWFNRFFKDDNAPIRTVADKVLQPSELKVFDLLPEDETVTTIDETFVAAADARSMPDSKVDLESQADRWLETLHKKTFAAWPEEAMTETDVRLDSHVEHDNIVRSRYTFDSGPVYRLPFYLLESVNGSQPSTRNRVEVLDQSDWDQLASALTAEAPGRAEWQHLEDRLSASTADKLILFPPRGVGPTEWTRDPVERRHLRRRFLLLGQTDDAMRIWDVRRLLVALRTPQLFADNPIELAGERDAAAWALYASLFAGGVDSLELTDLPSTHREGISLLNVSRFLEMPQVVQMAMVSNGKTKLIGSAESIAAWQPIVNASLVDKARLSLSTKENRQ